MKSIIRFTRQRKQTFSVEDQLDNPTYTSNIANTLRCIVNNFIEVMINNSLSTYHFSRVQYIAGANVASGVVAETHDKRFIAYQTQC